MTDTPATPALTIRVGSTVPEIYIDGYQGAQIKDGVLKLNLFSQHLDPATNATCNEVVARLALSIPTLISLYASFGGLLKELGDAGVITIQDGPKPQ